MLINDDCIRISGNKSRVGSVGTVKVILDENKRNEAERNYIANEYKPRTGKTAPKEVTTPDHAYLRYTKHPVLIIYLMTCDPNQETKVSDEKVSDAKVSYEKLKGKTITALGLGFPRIDSTKEKRISYKINMIEQQNLYGYDYEIEGDEDED